jgi:multicomponent Na+:H+ antiporter subunit B
MSTILTRTIARLILLPTLVAAVAFVIKGYASAGDGFSGGVVAGTAVVLQLMTFGPREVTARFPRIRQAPLLAFGGLLIGLITAFAPVLLGDPILTHYPKAGEHVPHIGLLAFHTAVLFDIAIFLIVFGFVVSVFELIGARTPDGEEST